ncbi:MAG: hypothetical protein ACXVIS_07765 [Halobacteriota archaeon]
MLLAAYCAANSKSLLVVFLGVNVIALILRDVPEKIESMKTRGCFSL